MALMNSRFSALAQPNLREQPHRFEQSKARLSLSCRVCDNERLVHEIRHNGQNRLGPEVLIRAHCLDSSEAGATSKYCEAFEHAPLRLRQQT